jgi:protocatechuate 3,4-dioxygenase beta subunit
MAGRYQFTVLRPGFIPLQGQISLIRPRHVWLDLKEMGCDVMN